mmetsp:Transcript_42306/g.77869  ORF Transcript_42306/g.77869 Transcript_42306/m.77869 type:complete len:111 (-) Transcript_42306:6-338(-)
MRLTAWFTKPALRQVPCAKEGAEQTAAGQRMTEDQTVPLPWRREEGLEKKTDEREEQMTGKKKNIEIEGGDEKTRMTAAMDIDTGESCEEEAGMRDIEMRQSQQRRSRQR